jgi:hypothetical protein
MATAPDIKGLLLDFLHWPNNVHWASGHFLYSGADGMFGSKDGKEWQKLKSGAVPATGLAWVDDVWVATGNGGPWRSEDGGRTWQSAGAPQFEQVAGCKPEPVTTPTETKEKKGIFAGYKRDEEGGNEEVYISRDLGKTWSAELAIPLVIPFGDNEDGYEFATVLSGCGNGIFLSTVKGNTRFSAGDGCVYALMDGGGFGGRQQIWSGTTSFFGDPDPHSLAYTAGAVGFDSQTKAFCLMYGRFEGFGPGGSAGAAQIWSVGYGTGSGASFGGENEIARRTRAPLADTFAQLAIGLGAAGGDGKFAGTYQSLLVSNVLPVSGQLIVTVFGGGTGSETLISVPNMDGESASQNGPICWKSGGGEESSTDATTETKGGTFACVAFGVDAQGGGVWIAESGGAWHQTHTGQAFPNHEQPRTQRAALAVGSLSWLDSEFSESGIPPSAGV